MRTDVELMLKAKAGSTAAFDWLIKRHHKAVVQFFHWRLWDKSMAEDLAQDVWIKLFKSLESYDPRGPFKSYLFSIATNHLRDHMRRVKVRPSWISLQGAGGGDNDDGGNDLLDKLTAVEMPPEAHLEASETQARLQQALSELPEEQYLVFSMFKHEDKKYEEIAQELGIKLGTVKSRMNAAYQHLRRAVYVDGADGSSSGVLSPGDKPPSKKSLRRSPKKRSKRSKRTNAKSSTRTSGGRATRSTRRTLLPPGSDEPDGGGTRDNGVSAGNGKSARGKAKASARKSSRDNRGQTDDQHSTPPADSGTTNGEAGDGMGSADEPATDDIRSRS